PAGFSHNNSFGNFSSISLTSSLACNRAWATGCNKDGIFSTGPLNQTSESFSFPMIKGNFLQNSLYISTHLGVNPCHESTCFQDPVVLYLNSVSRFLPGGNAGDMPRQPDAMKTRQWPYPSVCL